MAKMYREKLSFSFVSEGPQTIFKVIQYEYALDWQGFEVFNLAFGDYNLETGDICDSEVATNGDVYKVFNTVLHTVPIFFEKYPEQAMVVGGSDSAPEFIEECKINCARKCKQDQCKKAGRRINAYKYFVKKNFEELNGEYSFFGGQLIDGQLVMQDYTIENSDVYNYVLVIRKRSNFAI
jgi:hypothetical protein